MNDKYTSFLESSEMSHFQQSREWAQVKANWKNELITVRDASGAVRGVASVLIRKIPFFGNMMYVPRGPVCDIHDADTLERITGEIKALGERYDAFVVRMEPNVPVSDEGFRSIAGRLGYRINSSAQTYDEEIQARHNYELKINGRTKEEVFASFAKKTRYNIRLAERHGVEIRQLGMAQMGVFCALMEETARRNGFIPRSREYFERLCTKMGGHAELYGAYYEGEPVSAVLIITYGDKAWYLYGASGGAHRNSMANYLLQWRMIENAIDRGLSVYSFGGSPGKLGTENGLYRFKMGFGTELVELIGEVYIPFKPATFRVYHTMEKYFKRIRRRLYRLKNSLEEQETHRTPAAEVSGMMTLRHT